MKLAFVLLGLTLLRTGCNRPSRPAPAPCPPRRPVAAVIPQEMRQHNYGPSCAHASMITVLRWQGQPSAAQWWRRNGYGSSEVLDLRWMVKRAGLRYVMTNSGNAAYLEWITRTRRACVLQYQYRHAVTFVGFRDGRAVIIDNRWPRREVFVEQSRFLKSWRAYGGHAITVVDLPPPPKPWR